MYRLMCVCVCLCADGESEKTMSVLVDDVETLVHFIDVETASQQVTVTHCHVTGDVIGHPSVQHSHQNVA